MEELRGKVAFVTGGSGGFGQAMCDAFAAAGASVVVADLPARHAQVEDVVQRLTTSGRAEAVGVALDVRDVRSVRAAVDEAVATLGGVDIAVCNAGLNVRKPSLDLTEDDWDAVVDVNLKGVFFSAQAAAVQMIKQGRGGKIVSIASIMGLVASARSGAAYCASKGGVVNLTRELAVEWAQHGINVNAVAPTYAITPLTESVFQDEQFRTMVLERTPNGRFATPESIADAVVFLGSPRADMITGVTLPVDGGWTAV